jgi:hypothetical protein
MFLTTLMVEFFSELQNVFSSGSQLKYLYTPSFNRVGFWVICDN